MSNLPPAGPLGQSALLCARASALRAQSAATRRHSHELRLSAQIARERRHAHAGRSEETPETEAVALHRLASVLGRIPLEEHTRFLGILRDAVKAALAGDTADGMAMLDLGLAWTETGLEDPWLDDLVLCYRTAMHLFCDRFVSPSLEEGAYVFRSAELRG